MFLMVEIVQHGMTITAQGYAPLVDYFILSAWPTFDSCQMAIGIMQRLGEDGDGLKWACVPTGRFGA